MTKKLGPVRVRSAPYHSVQLASLASYTYTIILHECTKAPISITKHPRGDDAASLPLHAIT